MKTREDRREAWALLIVSVALMLLVLAVGLVM